jgi:hypothetical protein
LHEFGRSSGHLLKAQADENTAKFELWSEPKRILAWKKTPPTDRQSHSLHPSPQPAIAQSKRCRNTTSGFVRYICLNDWPSFIKISSAGSSSGLINVAVLASESRRGRVLPLLSQAILQAQSQSRRLGHGQPRAVIASRNISQSVIQEVLRFVDEYADDVAIGLFDERGVRVFRGSGLENLNSPPAEVPHDQRSIPKPKSYPLLSGFGAMDA